jgi:hypothetical protein
VVARSHGSCFRLVGEPQYSSAGEKRHPLMAVFCEPLAGRRGMTSGQDPFEGETGRLYDYLEEFTRKGV